MKEGVILLAVCLWLRSSRLFYLFAWKSREQESQSARETIEKKRREGKSVRMHCLGVDASKDYLLVHEPLSEYWPAGQAARRQAHSRLGDARAHTHTYTHTLSLRAPQTLEVWATDRDWIGRARQTVPGTATDSTGSAEGTDSRRTATKNQGKCVCRECVCLRVSFACVCVPARRRDRGY